MARKAHKKHYDAVDKTGSLWEFMQIRYKSEAFPPEQRKKVAHRPRRPNINRRTP